MTPEQWAEIRKCCRDQGAFERLQGIMAEVMKQIDQARSQAIADSQHQLERHQALFRVITRIREALDLDTLFQATATEVRQLLNADRVGMFRFYPDSGWDDGEFVSEAVDPAFPSALAAKLHDHCFGDQFAIYYQAGRIQAVADIHHAGLSDCHIQILSQFHVRANLVVPLLAGSQLWGLLCIHQCRQPRSWQPIEITFVSQIAHHLGLALQQAELLEALRSEVAERQQAQQAMQQLNQELQRLVLELTRSNQELEAFSYSVSHDLRAPLRSIDGFSQALLEDYQDEVDEVGQGYLQRIRTATQRMGQLIDDLLQLSRVMRSEVQWEPVDLSALAEITATELHQSQPDRQVEFLIEPGLLVRGDPQLLRILIANLLDNAWKFTSKHPQARIELGCIPLETGTPAYFVRDDGAGFDMAYADKLFSAFQRLHSMRDFPGNGIGLATIQRIIHRHGGQVWAEAAVEQGATFYFTLPGVTTYS